LPVSTAAAVRTLSVRCFGLMVPMIAAPTPGWPNSNSKLRRTGSSPGRRQAWPLASAFLIRMPLAWADGVVEHRAFGLLVEVVGDHRTIAVLQRQQAALDGLAGQPVGENLALALELGECLVDLGVAQNIHVVAVRVHQHQVDAVGAQAREAAVHREARVGGGEIEARLAVVELLADLADDHPVVALAGQQRPQAFLADAVGRCGVDQVDAQLASERQQSARLRVVGNGEAAGVFHALVAAQLDRAEAQRGDRQPGAAERPMQVMQRRAHSRPSRERTADRRSRQRRQWRMVARADAVAGEGRFDAVGEVR